MGLGIGGWGLGVGGCDFGSVIFSGPPGGWAPPGEWVAPTCATRDPCPWERGVLGSEEEEESEDEEESFLV